MPSYLTDYEIKTPPAVEPVSVDEVKEHIRIPHSEHDDMLGRLITAARKIAEESITNRQFITATYLGWFDEWWEDELRLPMPKLQSVGVIKYTDIDGVLQTLDSSYYETDTVSLLGRVYTAYLKTLPTHRSIKKAMYIEWTSGYGDAAANVDEDVRLGIMQLVADMYRNPESTTNVAVNEVPNSADNIFGPAKVVYL